MDEARSLLNQRLDPGWSFASFYLVKDSLALLLEGAGEDAARNKPWLLCLVLSYLAAHTRYNV